MQSLLVYLTSKARKKMIVPHTAGYSPGNPEGSASEKSKKMIVPHTAGYRPLCPQCEYQKFCSDQVHKVNNHFT